MLLEELFVEVLRLSFYGSIGCGVILVCILINYTRAPRWISMILWGLIALRLTVPFSFSSAVSLLQFHTIADFPNQFENTFGHLERTYSGNYKTALEGSIEYEQAIAAGSPIASNTDGSKTAYYYRHTNGKIEPAKTIYEYFLSVGSRVWAAGVISLWFWSLLSYIRLKYQLQFSMFLYQGVYETDAISSPCVVGFIKPQIYLIPGLTDLQKTHILLHEQMHIRYLDPIWKALSFLIISIHWFNPFLWLMYKVFQGELEKACDERVLACLGEDKKADYSESLLALAASKAWNQNQKWKFPTPIAFGENHIKSRIKQILTYKKPLTIISVLTVLLAIAGCGIFLTIPNNSSIDLPETSPTITANSNLYSDDSTQPTDNTDFTQTDPQTTDHSASTESEIRVTINEVITLENTEVYEELEYNGILYQAGDKGIFRKAKNGSAAEQIYAGFAGTNLHMTIFEEKLYFKTDSTYTADALDWADNTVRWINLESLDTGDLSMVRENALISYFWIYNGIIQIYYSYPDIVDTMMLYAEEDTAFNHKNITRLSKSEQQQFGLSTTQTILQNIGQLINVSNRIRGQNIAYLDIDVDGTVEKITLAPSTSPDAVQYYREDEPLAYYHLQIDNTELERSGENVANILWALSLDGQHILLVLYEDGPSADPYTHFFQYQNGQIIEIGGFEDDIRLCEISTDGIITSAIRKDIVQTDWIAVRWQLGLNGMLEQIPQDVYDFQSRNWVQLHEELPLHTAVGTDEIFTIKPQNAKFLQTSSDWNWVLLETQDGQQGWVHLDNFEVIELQKNVMDVFDGLYMAG